MSISGSAENITDGVLTTDGSLVKNVRYLACEDTSVTVR
jgi:hypothetical protein